MAQPIACRITCDQCNGWYNSEHELREHMQAAHRRFVTELNPFFDNGTEQNSGANPPASLKKE
jgi:hypothetical protein